MRVYVQAILAWLKALWLRHLSATSEAVIADAVVAIIVPAVGTAVASKDGSLSQRLEAAMSQAVLNAMAEGITDSDVIRDRKLAARAAIKAEARTA